MTKPSPRESNPLLQEYAQLAPDYDRKWSFYVQATTRETIKRLSLQPTDRLLDVGCGTGVLLHQLARLHSPTQLTGVDPVPEMLAVARRRLPAAIQLYEGWAERLPFQREQFDAVVSCNMFHYIREPAKALREMGRVLRPGGQLVITDWCDDYWACRVCDRCLRLFNRAHFKVYGEQECVQMLKDAGYALVKMDRYKITWLWGLMTSIATRNARATYISRPLAK